MFAAGTSHVSSGEEAVNEWDRIPREGVEQLLRLETKTRDEIFTSMEADVALHRDSSLNPLFALLF